MRQIRSTMSQELAQEKSQVWKELIKEIENSRLMEIDFKEFVAMMEQGTQTGASKSKKRFLR